MTDQAAFIALCKDLRELGATEVTAGEFSAKFAPVSQLQSKPTPAQPHRRTAQPHSEIEMLPGDGEDDRDRRARYGEVSALIAD